MTTTYFISRHPGALEWLSRQGVRVDQTIDHLDMARIEAGDTVIGTLPVNLAADVCDNGAQYVHLSLRLPPALRGQELSAQMMDELGARLEAYHVTRKDAGNAPNPGKPS